jgi:hypothetical protein
MGDQDDVTVLVERYLDAVATLSRQLAESYGVDDLFAARNEKAMPREGSFGEGGEYQFHGSGCTIDDGSMSVNFNFFDNGRVDGFDAWRLHIFAEDNGVASDLSIDTSRKSLEAAIKNLVAAGRAIAVSGNLYILK